MFPGFEVMGREHARTQTIPDDARNMATKHIAGTAAGSVESGFSSVSTRTKVAAQTNVVASKALLSHFAYRSMVTSRGVVCEVGAA